VRDNIKARKDGAANEAEAKYWTNVEKNFKIYQTKLGNDMFQNGIIKQAQYHFRMRGFFEELDSYEDVIGVGNGILKLGVEPLLIKGFHEYKISKYTEVNYVPYDPNNPYIRVLIQAFMDIFPEPDVFRFMMMHMSTGLDRYESACILLMLIGGGQNGKTFAMKMLHNTLGNQYCALGKSALLTSPMERGESANSAQMQQMGKNYFYFDEFNRCEILNTGRVKGMVNPGWQSGRDLNVRQCNFKNINNPVLLSNFELIIETRDHGTWRRIYYYNNKVKFCKNPDPNNKWEKKANTALIDSCPNDPLYLEAMLSILVHYNTILHRDYKNDIKNIPVPTIDYETEVYRNRMDTINRFITQMIVKSPDSEPILNTILAQKYQEWYNQSIKAQGQTLPDVQSEFTNSKVAPSMSMHECGLMALNGHRVKATADEPLQPGESTLMTAHSVAPEIESHHYDLMMADIGFVPGGGEAIRPTRSPKYATIKTDLDPELVAELISEKYAPVHLQRDVVIDLGNDPCDESMDNLADLSEAELVAALGL
jgi:phage/plasmid-associated DNA primase